VHEEAEAVADPQVDLTERIAAPPPAAKPELARRLGRPEPKRKGIGAVDGHEREYLELHYAEGDRLVVPVNGAKIADRVPGAKLVLVPNANHVLTTDQTDVVNQLLLEWFAA